jgi:ribosome-binding protein aMBF1 (putative translation factor)
MKNQRQPERKIKTADDKQRDQMQSDEYKERSKVKTYTLNPVELAEVKQKYGQPIQPAPKKKGWPYV